MIIELIIVLLLLITGCGFLRYLGFKGSAILPLGLLSGISIFVVASYVLAIFSIPYPTFAGLFIAVLLSFLLWLQKAKDQKSLRFMPLDIALSIAGVTILVFYFWDANLLKFHFDSIRYLITSSLLASDNLDSISMNLTTKRFSSVSILHSLGHISGDFYMRSITPLISISTIWSLFWLARNAIQATAKKVAKPLIILVISSVIFSLITNHSYIWHSFYINGHLLFGAFLLLLSGASWLIAARTKPEPYLVGILVTSIAGLILTRPEAALFCILALAPLVFSSQSSIKLKTTALASLGLSLFIQQFFIYKIFSSMGRSAPETTIGLLVLSVSILGFIFFIKTKLFNRYLIKWGLNLLEISLWLLLFIFIFADPTLMASSMKATIQNIALGRGNWGVFFVVLPLVAAIMIVLKKIKHEAYLRFPLTTFIPLVFLLAYLRGIAYRVGVTDSLNRMLMQVLPLLVFYIFVAVMVGRLRRNKAESSPE